MGYSSRKKVLGLNYRCQKTSQRLQKERYQIIPTGVFPYFFQSQLTDLRISILAAKLGNSIQKARERPTWENRKLFLNFRLSRAPTRGSVKWARIRCWISKFLKNSTMFSSAMIIMRLCLISIRVYRFKIRLQSYPSGSAWCGFLFRGRSADARQYTAQHRHWKKKTRLRELQR